MKERGVTQTIYVPPVVHEAIQKRAKQQRRSFSAIAVELLEEQMKREEEEQAKAVNK
jgi:predicted transcriptional regulator